MSTNFYEAMGYVVNEILGNEPMARHGSPGKKCESCDSTWPCGIATLHILTGLDNEEGLEIYNNGGVAEWAQAWEYLKIREVAHEANDALHNLANQVPERAEMYRALARFSLLPADFCPGHTNGQGAGELAGDCKKCVSQAAGEVATAMQEVIR